LIQSYETISKDKFKKAFDTALHTGMRYRELRLFSEHPEWHRRDKYEIFLPKKYTKTRKDRYVHLTKNFNKILTLYLKDGLYYPHPRTWYDSIRRWSKQARIKDWHNINSKTTRKTWESWLVKSGYDSMRILLSQGHIQATAILYYINLSFTDEEIKEIKLRTSGWTG
jgi:integrase